MKYILCQPAIKRFKWELEVCLTNLRSLGINDIVLLFSEYDSTIPAYLADKYNVEVHVYRDDREDKGYIPSIKPYLWWQYLKEDPKREKERYVYIDSDVIFNQKIDLRKMTSKEDVWYCSDCNHYLNLDYIRSCENGESILKGMAEIVNVSVESLETINFNSGGAQWVIKNPRAEYWKKVYFDSNRLYQYFKKVNSNIQKWTAEMWAQLWNMMYFNVGPKIHEELSFCFSTDSIEKCKQVKILHNAGVTEKDRDLFFKGKYVDTSPFEDDLSFVNKRKASAKYVEAIKRVSR
ncbi:hypothetical protein [Enterococcus gallinarum]|uniref:hypothetical protein n=1 Tax=Enterococcus gallinarum TaxID=1353 RepID=UPI0018ABAD62|nr:hypothetical protein [Enterococcus gallinarum]